MDPKDPIRAAHFLLQQHGGMAKNHAMDRALDMRAAGDEPGERAWLRVFDAVLALETDRPADGERVH